MTEANSHQYYNIFLTLIVFIDVARTYQMFSLTDARLCSPITKRKIKLGSDTSSGLIVSLGRLGEHSLSWEKNFLCKFQVDTANTNNGLFVVIQNLVFRKNETTDECVDYIQYKRQDGALSKKYCGRLQSSLGMDPIFAPDVYATNLTPTINSFDDPKGGIDVYVYISREPLHSYEEMVMEIVFTSYRNCLTSRSNDEQCSSLYPLRCIHSDFFNDGYINCPYPGCVDEDGCAEKVQKESVGNKVIIGSVTSLLVIFALFVCIVLCCRKFKMLCWAEDFSNTRTASSNGADNHISRTAEMSEQVSRSIPMASMAVPSARGVVSLHDEDKDLPPSYNSLFPDR